MTDLAIRVENLSRCCRIGATERVARSTLALPFSGRMTEGQVERVCQALAEVIGE